MMDPREKLGSLTAPRTGSQSLQRLQLEMALESRNTGKRPLAELLADAADAAGADLLIVLPGPNGAGMTAVLRLKEDAIDSFLQVRATESGFFVAEQPEMDQDLLRLARASVDVLGRMADDGNIREPIAAAE
jgi:hypothetical protein